MKIEDTQLVCIKSKKGGYTVYPKNMCGLVIEVEKLEDAPKKIAMLYQKALEFGFENDTHIITEITP